jgi:hypothetical protein
MKLKRKEFADLKQGGMTVNEYLNSFIQLSRYAPDDINWNCHRICQTCMMYFTCRMEELDLGGDLTYSERPVKILDMTERVTRNKVIKMCMVQWSHHTEDEATWEHEEELRADYPELFPSAS